MPNNLHDQEDSSLEIIVEVGISPEDLVSFGHRNEELITFLLACDSHMADMNFTMDLIKGLIKSAEKDLSDKDRQELIDLISSTKKSL